MATVVCHAQSSMVDRTDECCDVVVGKSSSMQASRSSRFFRHESAATSDNFLRCAEIRKTEKRGFGVFAAKDLKRGETIWEEEVLVSVQTPIDELCAKVCTKCMRALESITAQATHVSGVKNISHMPLLSSEDAKLTSKGDHVLCPYCCVSEFCSRKCFASAATHRLKLCVHLAKFRDHALRTNHTFLLAAETVAQTVLDNVGQKRWWSCAFQSPAYWDVVAVPEDEDEIDFRSTCQSEVRESLLLLKHALRDCGIKDAAAAFLDLDSYGKICGWITTNSVSIEIASPLIGYLSSLASTGVLSKRSTDASTVMAPILDGFAQTITKCNMMDTESEDEEDDEEGVDSDGDDELCSGATKSVVPSSYTSSKSTDVQERLEHILQSLPTNYIEGSGMYPVLSFFNHSCVPNASVEFMYEHNTASILATRDIRKGSELFISYIPIEDLATPEERAEALEDYRFTCECSLCIEQGSGTRGSSRS